jgi:hypothetical protein
MEQTLRDYIDRIGWLLILLVIALYVIFNHSGNA